MNPIGIANFIMRIAGKSVEKQLEEVKSIEGCPHIYDCRSYDPLTSGEKINAMKAANDGKTAWEAPNLLWVYHDQPDFMPIHTRQVYRPRKDGKWQIEGGSSGRIITGIKCIKCAAASEERESKMKSSSK